MKQTYKLMGFLILCAIILLFIIYYIFQQEGFDNQTLKEFIHLQNVNNPNTFFDVGMLEQQVTNDDMKQYNKLGYWEWNKETKDNYNLQLDKSTIQQEYPLGSYMAADQLLYNQTAMTRILSWKTPEGQFLMNGAIVQDNKQREEITDEFGEFLITSQQIPRTEYSNSFVCNGGVMTQKGKGIYNQTYSPVDNSKLPELIPGFKFMNGVCNPCAALNNPPDYTCPFTLRNEPTSQIWKQLWNL